MWEINHISRETKLKLEAYKDLLLKWNNNINLISKADEQKLWTRHFIDSLQLLNYIKNLNIHLVDIGSGAGFPGMVLSLAGVKRVTLVESDEKKTMFLLQIAALSDNQVSVVNQRVENINLNADILTARAFANFDKIFSLTKNLKINDKMLLLKGSNYLNELEVAQKKWHFDYKLHNSITDINSKIVEITNLK